MSQIYDSKSDASPEETVCVYSAPDMIKAELLRGELEVAGIYAVIGEQVAGAFSGALAMGEGYAAEVRVPAESTEEAHKIVLSFVERMEGSENASFTEEELTAAAESTFDSEV